jgi:hypothetical protein
MSLVDQEAFRARSKCIICNEWTEARVVLPYIVVADESFSVFWISQLIEPRPVDTSIDVR